MACVRDKENIPVTFVHNGWTIWDPNPYRGKKFWTLSKTSKFSLAHLNYSDTSANKDNSFRNHIR